jgi:hypothetical protein
VKERALIVAGLAAVLLAAAWVPRAEAWACPADYACGAPDPAELGARVEKSVGDGAHYSQGSGIFIGGGLFLTAAHVVKYNEQDRNVTVLAGGRPIAGVLARVSDNVDVDLALIAVDPAALPAAARNQAAVALCSENPGVSQPVAVVSLSQVTPAVTIATPINSKAQMGTWTNLLTTGYHHGDSGGGVFDPRRRCLWGIISLGLSGRPNTDTASLNLTAFVPASDISAFLARSGK